MLSDIRQSETDDVEYVETNEQNKLISHIETGRIHGTDGQLSGKVDWETG